MKVTIEKTEKVKKEIDIEFPYYTKDAYNIYKFIDEYNCIDVYKGFNDYSISLSPHKTWALFYEPATENEFISQLNMVKSLIEKI